MNTGEVGLYLMLVLASVSLLAGLLLLRITSRLKKLGPNGTCSKDLMHMSNTGVFFEQGMVRSKNEKSVRPQSKRSRTFLSCVS